MSVLHDKAKLDIEALDDCESRIVLSPLERGYGRTLGNALRRIMLSSIPGAAVTGVHIKGVQHECDTIEGIKEDVIEILLNLKNLAVRVLSGSDADGLTLTLKQEGVGEVLASQFETPPDVRIESPELYICSVMEAGVNFEMTVTIGVGVGYDPADQRETEEGKTIGDLEVDAIYSPVRQVAYQVENVRVAGRTDLDRLIMLLKTDGTVTPAEVLGHAALQLRRQLQPLVSLIDGVEEEEFEVDPLLLNPIEELGLENRIANILTDTLGLSRIGDLARISEVELLETPRLSVKSVDILKEKLAEHGLELGSSIPGLPPVEKPHDE